MADCCSNGSCRGHIPVEEIIRDCDRLFNEENTAGLGEHLRFWRRKALELGDKKGELSMLNELVGHYRMNRDEVRGRAAVEEALALIAALDIAQTLSAGTIFLNCATALQSFGSCQQAAALYQQAEACYQAHLAAEDERFAGLYNNMASVYVDTGAYDSAERCYGRALDILKKSGNQMDLAVTYINLAQLYDALDPEDTRIETLLDQAAACFDNAEINGYYAHTCRKCASALGYFGRFADEADLNQKADAFYGRK